MFALILASVFSVNVHDTTRLGGVSLEVSFRKVSIVREEKPLTIVPSKVILLDTMKVRRNVKPNPDWLVVDSRF